MSIKFAVYNTPSPDKNGTQLQHGRVISSGTQNLDRICGFISECSSLSSSDVKGVLEALVVYIGRELAEGYSIDLEGLGHYSPSLRSKEFVNEKGKKMIRTEVKGVNFRCSNRLKELVQEEGVKRVQRKNLSSTTQAKRKETMLEYLTGTSYINISDYAKLNDCSYYLAEKDIKLFLSEGIIGQMGCRTHRVYVLSQKKKMNT